MFVLRGQDLMYYTIEQSARYNYGAHKGTMDLRGASVERLEGLQFALTLKSAPGTRRVFTAPDVQALMDWMTAISVSASAITMEPPLDRSVVDHSRTTHIILVRHGQYQTSSTAAQDIHGPLTPLGIAQSKLTGAFLNEYFTQRQVFKRFPRFPIYHSGMRRAVETAQYIAQSFPKDGFELRENKLFREAWPGNPLPSTNRKMLAREKMDNIVSDCARLRIVWRTTFRHLIPDDLSLNEYDLSEQDKAQFADLFGSKTQHRTGDRYRLIVCHANVMRWLVCRALGVDPEATWGRMRCSNCAITELEIDSVGNVQVSFMNQTAHLPTAQITEN
jgi:serine/threonine-protein phosphatase PGAM5